MLKIRVKYLFLFTLLSASLSYSETYMSRLGNFRIFAEHQDTEMHLWVKFDGEKNKIYIGKSELIPQGTQLFHWTNMTDEIMNEHFGHGIPKNFDKYGYAYAVAGAGFYVSTNPSDSLRFGNRLLVATMPSSVRAISTVDIQLSKDQKDSLFSDFSPILRKIGIQALKFRDTWYNFISPEPLDNVRWAYDGNKTFKFSKIPAEPTIERLLEQNPENKYLLETKNLHAFFYENIFKTKFLDSSAKNKIRRIYEKFDIEARGQFSHAVTTYKKLDPFILQLIKSKPPKYLDDYISKAKICSDLF